MPSPDEQIDITAQLAERTDGTNIPFARQFLGTPRPAAPRPPRDLADNVTAVIRRREIRRSRHEEQAIQEEIMDRLAAVGSGLNGIPYEDVTRIINEVRSGTRPAVPTPVPAPLGAARAPAAGPAPVPYHAGRFVQLRKKPS